MSILLMADDFDQAAGNIASAGTGWTVKTGDTWTLTGTQVRVDAAPSSFRRMELQSMNPYTLLTLSTPRMYEVEVQFVTPSTYSSTEETYAGVTAISAGANAASTSMEARWVRASGGGQTIVVGYRTSASAVGGPLVGGNVSIASLAEGTTNTLKLRLTFLPTATNAIITFAVSLNSVIAAQGSFIFYSTFGFETANITTTPHYAGLVAYAPGPASGPPATPSVMFPIYFDNFRLRDVGNLAEQPVIFPSPSLTSDPTLADLTIVSEDDSAGDSLTVHPSYAIELQDQDQTNEHPYDSGHVATVAQTSKRRRRWDLHWDGLNASRRSTLEALAVTTEGRRKAFSWAEPDTGFTIKVRFGSDLTVSQIAPTVWVARGTLEEVYA